MADPYAFPTAAPRRGSRFSILTLIGLLFLAFMVYQVSANINDAEEQIAKSSLKGGDRIEYDYTARLPDGTLWETTDLDAAQRANQTYGYPLQPEFSYAPKQATLNPDRPALGWGPEIEQKVVDAHIGQTLRFQVPVAYGTGDWEEWIPGGAERDLRSPSGFQRTVFLQEGDPRSGPFNLTQLNQAIGPLENGTTFKSPRAFPPTWNIVFDDVNFANRSVTFHHTVQDGQAFDVPGLPGQVLVLLPNNETDLVYRLDLDVGGTFVVRDGSDLATAGFDVGSYSVRGQNETHIDLLYSPQIDPAKVGLPLTVEMTINKKITPQPAGQS